LFENTDTNSIWSGIIEWPGDDYEKHAVLGAFTGFFGVAFLLLLKALGVASVKEWFIF
jgi:hypothetical protein